MTIKIGSAKLAVTLGLLLLGAACLLMAGGPSSGQCADYYFDGGPYSGQSLHGLMNNMCSLGMLPNCSQQINSCYYETNSSGDWFHVQYQDYTGGITEDYYLWLY